MELQFGVDYNHWYEIDKRKLRPKVQESFKVHYYDKETEKFIVESCNISYFKHVFDNTMSIFLTPFVSATSRNAILNRGIMFVASSELFNELLAYSNKSESVLDIGAGCGNVTERFAGSFDEVYATETCSSMQSRLEARGYTVLDIDKWTDRTYSVIACLNVLDRCHEPYKLLEGIYNCLAVHGGTAIIALVLPYHGSVEEGHNWNAQREPLKIKGVTFEEQLSSLVVDVLGPLGFELNLATKVPYLCSGDLYNKYYSLNDCLLSLNVRPNPTLALGD